MNEQCLKLTAYFGERQRAVGGAGRFLADAMLDLFGSHNVATSVMLRGTTSFGPKHEFRCDQSLSLSEDPPVTVAAVDIESKIRSLVDDVTAMTDRGLVTLERARLVTRHKRRRGIRRHRQPKRRCRQAHHLRRPPGAGCRGAGLLHHLRAFASTWIRRCHSAARRRRHGTRSAPPGPVLRPQRQCSTDDHCRRNACTGCRGRNGTHRSTA